MNQEDIIRMAREAGFLCDEDWITYGLSQFEHFAVLVAAHEREECAQLVQDNIDPHNAWITPDDIKEHFGIES